MKNIIYKLSFLLLGFAIVMACTSPEGETNYIPAEYVSPQSFSIEIDAASLTETSSELIYTSTVTGKGYYVVTAASSGIPTSTQVHDASASGILQSGNFAVDGSTPVVTVLDANLDPGYPYNVHAIHKSIDDFISEGIVSASFTTPDDTAPELLTGDSNPAHGSEGSSPFLSSVTFAFSEHVFYQGNDITFNGFFGGSEVVFTASDLDPSSAGGGTSITFNTSVQWSTERDAFVGSFDEGTFVDNVGNPIAELSGFSYFFYTRDFTFIEIIGMNLTGEYDYTIVDNSGTVPVLSDGVYNVVQDGDEITVINGIATAVGFTNEHVLRVQNDDDGDGIGYLFLVENPQPSIYSAGGTPLYWHPFFNDTLTAVVGEYDFNTGEFYYLLDFADELGWQGGFYLGWFEYYFTPTVTGRSATGRSEGVKLKDRPETIQLKQDMMDIKRNSGVTIRSSVNNMEFIINN